MELIFSLLQQLSVYLVIAYLLSKTPLFMPLTTVSGHFSQRLACYVLFSLFCILGRIRKNTKMDGDYDGVPCENDSRF